MKQRQFLPILVINNVFWQSVLPPLTPRHLPWTRTHILLHRQLIAIRLWTLKTHSKSGLKHSEAVFTVFTFPQTLSLESNRPLSSHWREPCWEAWLIIPSFHIPNKAWMFPIPKPSSRDPLIRMHTSPHCYPQENLSCYHPSGYFKSRWATILKMLFIHLKLKAYQNFGSKAEITDSCLMGI